MAARILGLFMFCSTLVAAQPGNPGGGGPPVPISGIEILIGAGGLYGVRKLMKKKNQSDN